MKRILITGANGMLGGTLCDIYSNKYQIAGLHREQKAFANLAKEYSADIRSFKLVKKAMIEFDPAVIIHCAGLVNLENCESNPGLAFDINVNGTAIVLKACPKKCLFIYISSDQVYGDLVKNINGKNIEDVTGLTQLNEYGKTKYLGEQEVVNFKDDYIIIRTNIFGWNVKPQKMSSAEWMLGELKKEKKITLFDDYWFSPLYTKYLGNMIEILLEQDFRGIINVASPKCCSKYEFGIKMAQELGVESVNIIKGSILNYKFSAKRHQDLSLNTKKAQQLGLLIPNWEESLIAFLNDKK